MLLYAGAQVFVFRGVFFAVSLGHLGISAVILGLQQPRSAL